jgi:hypothetical protein
MYTSKLTLVLLVFATTAMVTGPTVAASAASGPACGDTVTGNVVLGGDLNCVGTALHIVPGPTGIVTIDLKGHRLHGNGTGAGIDIPQYPRPGFKTVSVKNGAIWGFHGALGDVARPSFANGGTLTVDHVRFQANGSWLRQGFHYTNVTSALIVDSGSGGVADEGRLTVARSSLVRSSIGSNGETYNYLYNNIFSGGGFHHGTLANVIAEGNTFQNCVVGISLPDVWPYAPTRIEHNQFIGCQVGLAISTGNGTASVKGNTFTGNAGAGFAFAVTGSAAMTITGNQFFDNGGDGLTGAGPATVTVADNLADANGGHGINVAGVTDGGGNAAVGNTTTPDCVGVVCTMI